MPDGTCASRPPRDSGDLFRIHFQTPRNTKQKSICDSPALVGRSKNPSAAMDFSGGGALHPSAPTRSACRASTSPQGGGEISERLPDIDEYPRLRLDRAFFDEGEVSRVAGAVIVEVLVVVDEAAEI